MNYVPEVKNDIWTVEKKKVVGGLVIVLALVALWWYKTKTWPVAAVVNYQPITRYEIEKSLWEQGGVQVAESLITEALVKQELARLGIGPTEAEIDAKIEEIKKGLLEGQELEKLLEQSGMKMADLRERIRIQLGVEKVATDAAKISDWVEGLRGKARVWRFF
ncbi:SurA N-terminal domain-containing protein [Candidatus Amesbacteria bacterium]|nr:SurA N-terminal domain-containing protein [Candidatus Amesbacteria bacterium]